jgi:hypothetical protein
MTDTEASGSRVPALNDFLNRLDDLKVRYSVYKIRAMAILVEVFAPGEHWEIEFMDDGQMEIERYHSSGDIGDESELAELWALLDETNPGAKE